MESEEGILESTGLWRSKSMKYVQINAKSEFMYETVRGLAKHGKFHVVDLNEGETPDSKVHLALKRKVADCVKWERELENFEAVMKEYKVDIPIAFVNDVETGDIIQHVSHFLEPMQEQLKRNIDFATNINADVHRLQERSHVLRVCKDELKSRVMEYDRKEMDNRFNNPEGVELGELLSEQKFHEFICGTIPVAQQPAFERMVSGCLPSLGVEGRGVSGDGGGGV